jgi:hypothetical protein
MAWWRDIDAELILVISYLGSSDLWGREEPELRPGEPLLLCGRSVVSATGSSIPTKRRRARFRHSDGEGSTASWAGGQNRGGWQNREEDGGNGTLTLTKSSSVRITGKPDKVGSVSGSRTGIMSSNVFCPIQTLRFGLKQIWPKKDPLSYLIRAFGPAGWLQRTKGTCEPVARNLVTAN